MFRFSTYVQKITQYYVILPLFGPLPKKKIKLAQSVVVPEIKLVPEDKPFWSLRGWGGVVPKSTNQKKAACVPSFVRFTMYCTHFKLLNSFGVKFVYILTIFSRHATIP